MSRALADRIRARVDAIEATTRADLAELRALADQLESGGDVLLPLAQAAAEANVTPRMIRDAAARGQVQLEGPRSARGVRRRELESWLAARAPAPRVARAPAAGREDDSSAFARAARRAAAGGAT